MKKSFIVLTVLALIMGVMLANCTSSNPVEPAPGTPTMTATITPTFTSTMTPDSGTKLYTFNATDETWTAKEAGITLTARNTNASYIYSGAGSLAIGCVFNSGFPYGGFLKTFYNTPLDLRGKTVTVHLYVPSGLAVLTPAYTAILRVVDAAAGSWRNVQGPSLTVSGWNTVQIAVPSTADFQYVNYVGFWIYKGHSSTTPDWSGTVYADEIGW